MIVRKYLFLATFIILLNFSDVFSARFKKKSFKKEYTREMMEQKYPGYGTKWIFYTDKNNNQVIGHYEYDQSKIFFDPYDVNRDISFTLYTRSNPKGFFLQNITKLSESQSKFDKTKKTKFVTHGWMSNGKADTCIQIKDGFLKNGDFNVFVMDWSNISDTIFYPIPLKAVGNVAKHYGSFVNTLVHDFNTNPQDIHMVGHSLGAHVSGLAAGKVKGPKIARVTGLDPALPGFDQIIGGEHISSKNAQFVDVIHSCAGFLGLKDPVGHADFYPNGGSPPQPGCGNIIEAIEACSHGRSWKFFADSLLYPDEPFYAMSCASYSDYASNNGKCNHDYIKMGDPAPSTARGIFYLKTKADRPFSLGDGILMDNRFNKI